MRNALYSGDWNGWSFYWIVVWGLSGFLVPEMWALLTGHPENTLSDQVWRLAGVGNGGGWSFAHFVVAAFMVWLTGHFVWGLWH